MDNYVTNLIQLLTDAFIAFVDTDFGMILCGLVICALVIRLLDMLFHITRKD